MPNIFPQDNTVEANNIIISRRSPTYGRSPVFDFSIGEFKKVDGKVYIGEGLEVLKNRIEKTLRTERYRFPIYSPDYGVTLEELMLKDVPFEVFISEVESQIVEALTQDLRIAQVKDFTFSRNKSFIGIQFHVVTFDMQTMNMEVSV